MGMVKEQLKASCDGGNEMRLAVEMTEYVSWTSAFERSKQKSLGIHVRISISKCIVQR
jgi:hypothetical protein